MYTRAKQLIIILSFLSSDAYAQKAKVSGDIVGLDESTLEVNYAIGNSFKIDEIAVKNGKFTWEADMPYPQKVYIMIPQQHRNIEFYAESGNIKLIGNADSLDKVKIIGSKTQDEWDDFKKSLKDIIYGLETPLYNRNNKGTKEQNIAMEKKLDELRMEIRKKVDLYYITAHPKSAISVSLVSESSFGGYNNLKTLYNLLDTSAQQTIVGKQIANRLIVLKHGNLGERMLDFTQNNTEGNPVRFADYKGKYVLVDFWASWCGPCRAENPNVLKAYNKYKDKNFTVIGVSLDDNGEKWKKAIKDDNMPWTQLSDLKGWENEISTYYGIQGIPDNFLVDPQGKIIAHRLMGDYLEKKLAELFGG